ncbi:MAG: transglutaminase family protein [Solirubrobacteraceae bacterium]
MTSLPVFTELAGAPQATLDLLALALAAEFRETDAAGALGRLDALGGELADAALQTDRSAEAQALACAATLGAAHGFAGDRDEYDDPRNSMLDLVLTRRRGLPILLSVVYIEVARRAGITLQGVGLPGHFVVGHFGADPPVLLDPFAGGARLQADLNPMVARPWAAHDITMRMLNNLIAAYQRRGNVGAAIHAASLRLALPTSAANRDALTAELRALRARLN